MKTTGIVRNIDEVGRLVLPKEIRKQLEITHETPVEIFMEGSSIVLKKYSRGCIFCGRTNDFIEYKGKNICKKCISDNM